MLKCPKCGTDNLLTSIFCRGCGERMDLDALKPEDFENSGPKKNKNEELANMIAGIVLGVLAVVFIGGFLMPSCGTITPCSPDSISQELQEKYNTVESGGAGAAGISFTDQEASDLVTWRMSTFSRELEGPYPVSASIRMQGDGIRADLSAKMYGIPFTISGIAKFGEPSGENKSVSTECEKVRVGIFPVPESMSEWMFGGTRAKMYDAVGKMNNNLSAVEISDGKLVIKQAPQKKKRK